MSEKSGWSIKGMDLVSVINQGYETCLPAWTPHGRRCIIISAISNEGIIPKCTFVGEGGHTQDGDYHKTVNSNLYEEWFENQLLPNAVEASHDRDILIVIDNASYHCRTIFNKFFKRPTTKKELQNFLEFHGIQFQQNDTNNVLKELVAETVEEKRLNNLVLVELCQKFSVGGKTIKILRLPPYHSM
jgi:hypothetical protein